MAVLRTLHIWALRNTKKILRKYIPHDMFPHSSSSLNFYFYYYHFILIILFNFKDGDHSKIPFFFLHGMQANSLLKWKRVYYYWKAATFKEIFPREEKIPCLNWGRITLTKPNNPINHYAPFLVPRSSLYYKKEKKKKKKRMRKRKKKRRTRCGPFSLGLRTGSVVWK